MKVIAFSLVFFDNKFSQKFNLEFGRKIFLKNFFDFLIFFLLLLPLINTSAVRSSLYRPLYQKFFWFLVADFFLLSYLGQAPAESPYIEVGQVATIYYFGFFILLIPILGRLEKNLVYSI